MLVTAEAPDPVAGAGRGACCRRPVPRNGGTARWRWRVLPGAAALRARWWSGWLVTSVAVGARVIAAARGDQKLDLAKEQDAAVVVDYTERAGPSGYVRRPVARGPTWFSTAFAGSSRCSSRPRMPVPAVVGPVHEVLLQSRFSSACRSPTPRRGPRRPVRSPRCPHCWTSSECGV